MYIFFSYLLVSPKSARPEYLAKKHLSSPYLIRLFLPNESAGWDLRVSTEQNDTLALF